MDKKLPSDKKFGTLMCLIFFVFSSYFYFKSFYWTFYFCTLFAIFFLVITFLNSPVLTKLNSLWFSLGNILGNLISPFILGLIFFLLITPTAMIGKLLGRDILIIKRPTKIDSYWIILDKKDKDDDTFENQF